MKFLNCKVYGICSREYLNISALLIVTITKLFLLKVGLPYYLTIVISAITKNSFIVIVVLHA